MILALPCGRDVLLDDADTALIAPYRWFSAQQSSGQFYARGERHRGDPRVYMHRLITDAPAGMLVDHRNGLGLVNHRWNLRVCTVAQNNKNVARRSRRKAFKGVYADHNRFRAALVSDGVCHSAFGFVTAEEAARAYDDLARRFHGEFARLNFPDGD